MIFVLLRGCVILCVERLRDFCVWRGWVIFLTHSLRLHDLFFWRLHYLFCGEVTWFFCWEIVWRGCVILLCEEVAWFFISGVRRHRIKNTSSDFKHTQRPCLVQTEALFDEDRCILLQEWASVWMIWRLCSATRRPCLLKQTWCIVFNEITKTYFLNVLNRYTCS